MAEQSTLELLIRLKDQLTGPIAQATKGLKGFEQQLKRADETAKHLQGIRNAGLVLTGLAFAGAEALKGLLEPAAQFEEAQNALARATGATAEQLRQFQDQAEALSERLPVTAEAVTAAQATLARMLGSTNAAMQAMTATAQFAASTDMSAADAATLLGSAYESMGDKTKPLAVGFGSIADKLALLQSRYSTGTADGAMLARSFAKIAEASRTFGISIDQSAGALGVLNRIGLGGGRGAGPVAQELITQLGKLDKFGIPAIQRYGIALARNSRGGVDLVKTVDNLRRVSQNQAAAYIKSLGSAGEALTLLMDHYDDLKASVTAFDNAQGTLADLTTKRNASWTVQLQELKNAWENLKTVTGQALGPGLGKGADELTKALRVVTEFVKTRPEIVQIGAAITGVTIAFAALLGPILAIGAAVALLGAPFVLTAAAMLGIVAAIAAVSAAASVYKDAIGKFFDAHPFISGVLDAERILTNLPQLAREAGARLGLMFGEGIKSGLKWIEQAMHLVTATIRAYLPFSPAERGPLADLHRVRIVQTIAQSLGPGPIAGVVAGAGLAMGGAAFGGGVNFNPQVIVHAAGGASGRDIADEVIKALESRHHEFVSLVEHATDRLRRDWSRTGHHS
jgi:TP901 family phage tail tape measure protein